MAGPTTDGFHQVMKDAEREQLFRQVFMENRESIRRLCYGYVYHKDDVEDLFQEIMINIWSNLHTFREEASIKTWAYRISVNTALIHVRKIKRKNTLFSSMSGENVARNAFHDDDRSEEALEIEQLRNHIASLRPQDRLIITLLLEGLSYREISELVGISVNYIGVKINRIKRLLQKQLGVQDG